jgi:hypothetical protein
MECPLGGIFCSSGAVRICNATARIEPSCSAVRSGTLVLSRGATKWNPRAQPGCNGQSAWWAYHFGSPNGQVGKGGFISYITRAQTRGGAHAILPQTTTFFEYRKLVSLRSLSLIQLPELLDPWRILAVLPQVIHEGIRYPGEVHLSVQLPEDFRIISCSFVIDPRRKLPTEVSPDSRK